MSDVLELIATIAVGMVFVGFCIFILGALIFFLCFVIKVVGEILL